MNEKINKFLITTEKHEFLIVRRETFSDQELVCPNCKTVLSSGVENKLRTLKDSENEVKNESNNYDDHGNRISIFGG